jgi:hypothetical protein
MFRMATGRLSDEGQHRHERQDDDHAGKTEIGSAPAERSDQSVANHGYDDRAHSDTGKDDAKGETALTIEPGSDDFRVGTRRLADRHQPRQREYRVQPEHRAGQQ